MSPPIPLRRGNSLVDRVVQRIGQDIVSQQYPSGGALPNETEWCEQLDVSRSVLREALRVLVSKNLITIRARLGGRVIDRKDWNNLDPDILVWRSQGREQQTFAAELFELRRTIEPAAAAFAARRITVPQLEELRSAYREMAEAGEDTARFLKPDIRFHHVILSAVGNSLFQAMAHTIMVTLDITLRMSLDVPGGQQKSMPLHKAVLKALTNHEPIAASEAMMRLVDSSERDVQDTQATVRQKIKRAAEPGEGVNIKDLPNE